MWGGGQLGRVFVSSTFKEHGEARAAVGAGVELLGLDPLLTERAAGKNKAVLAALEEDLRGCDAYVGVFSDLEGTVPDDPVTFEGHRLSITEWELVTARRMGLRSLVFVRAEAEDREAKLAAFLKRYVEHWKDGLWARSFSTPAQLRAEVVAALAPLRPRVRLRLHRAQDGLQASVDLRGLQPTWTGPEALGPTRVDLSLSEAGTGSLRAFLASGASRSRLTADALRVLGSELWARALPGALGAALAEALGRAQRVGRLLLLDVHTEDPDALALPWELLQPGSEIDLPVRQGLLEVIRHVDDGRDAEPAPEVPASYLSVLGFTASPTEDHAGGAGQGPGPAAR